MFTPDNLRAASDGLKNGFLGGFEAFSLKDAVFCKHLYLTGWPTYRVKIFTFKGSV